MFPLTAWQINILWYRHLKWTHSLWISQPRLRQICGYFVFFSTIYPNNRFTFSLHSSLIFWKLKTYQLWQEKTETRKRNEGTFCKLFSSCTCTEIYSCCQLELLSNLYQPACVRVRAWVTFWNRRPNRWRKGRRGRETVKKKGGNKERPAGLILLNRSCSCSVRERFV